MPFSSGDRLLHFRILSKIGQGGMGEVYLAEDLKLGRKVAVKVLPASSASGPKAKLRLMQEARSASALNHQNIVTIHSIEEMDEVIFIVMEFVEGETLSSKLQQNLLPVPKLVDIGSQIAEGLAAAHDAGVIHRDIKSSNILVTENGRVKILDFGLAKQTLLTEDLPTGMEQITEEGTILGTVSYMSPEQVRGETLDLRSDIFSFGCVLYECATGRLPFRGPTPAAVMYQITTAVVIPPSSLRKDLPVNFDAILLRALAKDKGFRYASARALGEDLRASLFPETVAVSVMIPAHPTFKRDETFVGREQELQELQNDFQQAVQSSGATIFLTGEPGIGKTAICEEFLRRVAASFPDVLIARGRCVEHYGTGEAYLPFLDAIGALLSSPSRDRMVQTLRTHAPTWCTQFPGAFTSTGVLESSQKEAAAASKERMLREISDALLDLSVRSPLLLYLEDLHWADPSSADLLRYLSRRIDRNRVMILGTFREEELESGNAPMKACRLDLQAHSISHEIRMRLLPEPLVKDYLNRLYSPNSFPQELSALIFRKTEGHPLFITSLTQFLAGQDVITKQDNVWVLGRSLSEADLEMPENVRSMIRRKIDALGEEDLKILQYASIEGEEFSSTVLAALLDMDEIDLEERLSKLERAHRIIGKTKEEEWPDGSLVTRYRFTHALYQNALYAGMVTKRRVQLHKRTGDLLLKHHASKTRTIANQLGLHFQLGRDFEKAMQYLTQAADQARAVYANAEAAQLYGKALQQAGELLSKDPVRWRSFSAALHENRGDSLGFLGKQEEAKQEFVEALQLLDSPEVLARARLHRKWAKAVQTIRNLSEALEQYGEARSLLEKNLNSQSVEWQREWIQVNLDQTWLHYTQNQLVPMQVLIDRVHPYVESAGTASQKVRFYECSILLAYRRDRYLVSDETIQLLDRARKAAEESHLEAEIAMLNFVTGFASLWRGELDRSEHHFQLGLSQARRLEDAVLQSRFLAYIPVLYRRLNDVEKTRLHSEQSLHFATSINMQEYIALAKANLGWVYWRSGDFASARKECTEAVQIWQSLPIASPFQELALWPLIAVALQENDVSTAVRCAQAMLDPSQHQLEETVESLLLQAISDSEQAQDLLHQAATLVRPSGYL